MHFSAQDNSFFFVKYGARPFFARPFFKAQIFFFMIFFVLVCFQDEVKQLSSWKFFDSNRFSNRFGNDVFDHIARRLFQNLQERIPDVRAQRVARFHDEHLVARLRCSEASHHCA